MLLLSLSVALLFTLFEWGCCIVPVQSELEGERVEDVAE